MPIYVSVAVNVPQVSGEFDYHLPPDLENRVQPGSLVEVPFGNQRVQGVVIKFVEQPTVSETKSIAAVLDSEVVLTKAQLALASYLSESTLAPLSACITLMLPAGLSQMADTQYTLVRTPTTSPDKPLTPLQSRLWDLLEKRGSLLGRQIDRSMPRVSWREAMRPLVKIKLVSTQPCLPTPSVHPKLVRTARLACPPAHAQELFDQVNKKHSKTQPRRQAILNYLIQEGRPVEVTWLYAESGGNLKDLQVLAEQGLVLLSESQIWRDPLEGTIYLPSEALALTREQAAVWAEVHQGMVRAVGGERLPPYLLHGVTGSGKTEIYLYAVAECLQEGKSAIILVPEIALTPQTVRRFLARFPGQVGLMHSGLSVGERYDTWRRARAGDLKVIVGPRSALFTPMVNLGLIVVDECHDDSYFQDEILPYYHTREAAAAYSNLTGAVCLLGSATPDIVSRYRAEQGIWKYLHLPERILAHRETVRSLLNQFSIQEDTSQFHPLEKQAETIDLPPVRVIDMRQELQSGNRSIFSRTMIDSLKRVLKNQQQAILFLNRRGTASYVFCRECGHTLNCPRCDTPLIYHNPLRSAAIQVNESDRSANAKEPSKETSSSLICHHCGYRRNFPKQCPRCNSPQIRQYGLGTERVEAELHEIFPQARIVRWDYDTTRHKGAHEIILSHFLAHRADILIGTQMLAKGLDLPLVTLVGVVLADVGLNLPDFHAAEHTFQVLTQVAGRAGRSPLGGEVVLQTYLPDHYVIQAAAKHDYQAFYQREMDYRRQLGYPPFKQLVRLEYRHAQNQKAEQAAQQLATKLRGWLDQEERSQTDFIGPVPCFFPRRNNLFRWQIILRGPDPVSLLRGRQLGDWRIEINPPDLL